MDDVMDLTVVIDGDEALAPKTSKNAGSSGGQQQQQPQQNAAIGSSAQSMTEQKLSSSSSSSSQPVAYEQNQSSSTAPTEGQQTNNAANPISEEEGSSSSAPAAEPLPSPSRSSSVVRKFNRVQPWHRSSPRKVWTKNRKPQPVVFDLTESTDEEDNNDNDNSANDCNEDQVTAVGSSVHRHYWSSGNNTAKQTAKKSAKLEKQDENDNATTAKQGPHRERSLHPPATRDVQIAVAKESSLERGSDELSLDGKRNVESTLLTASKASSTTEKASAAKESPAPANPESVSKHSNDQRKAHGPLVFPNDGSARTYEENDSEEKRSTEEQAGNSVQDTSSESLASQAPPPENRDAGLPPSGTVPQVSSKSNITTDAEKQARDKQKLAEQSASPTSLKSSTSQSIDSKKPTAPTMPDREKQRKESSTTQNDSPQVFSPGNQQQQLKAAQAHGTDSAAIVERRSDMADALTEIDNDSSRAAHEDRGFKSPIHPSNGKRLDKDASATTRESRDAHQSQMGGHGEKQTINEQLVRRTDPLPTAESHTRGQKRNTEHVREEPSVKRSRLENSPHGASGGISQADTKPLEWMKKESGDTGNSLASKPGRKNPPQEVMKSLAAQLREKTTLNEELMAENGELRAALDEERERNRQMMEQFYRIAGPSTFALWIDD